MFRGAAGGGGTLLTPTLAISPADAARPRITLPTHDHESNPRILQGIVLAGLVVVEESTDTSGKVRPRRRDHRRRGPSRARGDAARAVAVQACSIKGLRRPVLVPSCSASLKPHRALTTVFCAPSVVETIAPLKASPVPRRYSCRGDRTPRPRDRRRPRTRPPPQVGATAVDHPRSARGSVRALTTPRRGSRSNSIWQTARAA